MAGAVLPARGDRDGEGVGPFRRRRVAGLKQRVVLVGDRSGWVGSSRRVIAHFVVSVAAWLVGGDPLELQRQVLAFDFAAPVMP